MFQIWNSDKVKPPLDQAELKRTFNSILAQEKKNQTTANKIDISSLLDDVNGTANEFKQNYFRVPFANDNLVNLEKQMNGGFAGGRFYLFGGIPSSGKTVLLNNIADNICLNGYPVLFFSYDDGRVELRYRTFSRFSSTSIEEFNLRTVMDIRSIWQVPSIQQIMARKYVVQQMIPVEKWCDLIDHIKLKHGKAPVIIIDYLRKLRTEKSIGDERLRVDDILSKLTEIAKTHNTPVIAISELARDSYKSGQRLSMASFKESGTIEYEASWLGILGAVDDTGKLKENWEEIIEHDGNVDLIIFKAKRGTGATGKIKLKVDKNLMTVSDRPSEVSRNYKYNQKSQTNEILIARINAMIKEEALPMLNRIIDDYDAIKDPKYRNADIETLKRDYDLLMEMKESLKGDLQYAHIVNAISQTIAKMTPRNENGWRSVTERGINKVIPPVVRKKNQVDKFPFEWIDKKSRESCFINNGYWGAKNYMVMDIIGYYLLLKEGKDLLPTEPAPIFTDMNSIAMRESSASNNNIPSSNQSTMNDQDIKRIENTRYWILFDDKEFRKSTSLDMSSNEIRNLLLETSRVEFQFVFPVRMWNGKKAKETDLQHEPFQSTV